MKNLLMFLSIFIVVCMAVYDMKERLSELEEVAANTPAQVEMKQDIRIPIKDDIKPNFNLDKSEPNDSVKVFQESEKYRLNQLESIEKRRNTIDNK